MRTLIMSLAAASALAIGAPAAAQFGGGNIEMRINELQARLQAGVQNGAITRQEAVMLRERLRELTRLERRFSSDGLNRAERDQLQQRIQMLRQQIRQAELNGRNSGGGEWDDRGDRAGNRGFCPPGLAKRNNGCLPPGQARRMGDRFQQGGGDAAQFGYRDNERFIFRQEGGRVLQIDRRTGQVVRVINLRR